MITIKPKSFKQKIVKTIIKSVQKDEQFLSGKILYSNLLIARLQENLKFNVEVKINIETRQTADISVCFVDEYNEICTYNIKLNLIW